MVTAICVDSDGAFVGSISVMPKRSLRGVLYGLGVFGMLVVSGYTVVQAANVRNAGQKFIGIKTFVQDVEQAWHQHYHTPLAYVGGEYMHEWVTFMVKIGLYLRNRGY